MSTLQTIFANPLHFEAFFTKIQDMIRGEIEEGDTWESLEAYLREHYNVHVEFLQGLQVQDMRYFPVATYGWDGGCPIETAMWNLKEITTSDAFGGPYASICGLIDTTRAGVVFHVNEDNITIQICL